MSDHPAVAITRHDDGSEYGRITVDIPEGMRVVTITPELLKMMVDALNRRAFDVAYARADQAEKSYREGFNAHARGEIHSYQMYGLGVMHLPGCVHDPRHPDHGAYPCDCAQQLADAAIASQPDKEEEA